MRIAKENKSRRAMTPTKIRASHPHGESAMVQRKKSVSTKDSRRPMAGGKSFRSWEGHQNVTFIFGDNGRIWKMRERRFSRFVFYHHPTSRIDCQPVQMVSLMSLCLSPGKTSRGDIDTFDKNHSIDWLLWFVYCVLRSCRRWRQQQKGHVFDGPVRSSTYR
jgi:hypothetical protein